MLGRRLVEVVVDKVDVIEVVCKDARMYRIVSTEVEGDINDCYFCM